MYVERRPVAASELGDKNRDGDLVTAFKASQRIAELMVGERVNRYGCFLIHLTKVVDTRDRGCWSRPS